MDEARVWLGPDLVARLELVALAEHRADVAAAKLGDDMKLRAGGLHYLHFGFGAVIGESGMVGPYAEECRSSVASRGRGAERKLASRRSLEGDAAVGADMS